MIRRLRFRWLCLRWLGFCRFCFAWFLFTVNIVEYYYVFGNSLAVNNSISLHLGACLEVLNFDCLFTVFVDSI